MANRDALTIESDRAEIAKLMRIGYRTAGQIATEMNKFRSPDSYVSPSQVATDVRAIKEKYKQAQIEDYDVARKEMLDRLFDLRVEAYKGFLRSQKNKVVIESEVVVSEEDYEVLKDEGLKLTADNERVFLRNAKVREEARPEGNHSFLQQIIQIEEKIAKIMGIDAPSKIALTDPSGQNEAESPLINLLAEINRDTKKQLTSGEDDETDETGDVEARADDAAA